MKTSTKIFIAALLFLVLSMLGYDYLLKKEFNTGKYKDVYAYYIPLNFKNFDVLDINASHIANVRLIQGPFSVKIESDARHYVKVKQTGTHLQIDVNGAFERYYNRNAQLLLISCPDLKSVNVNAFSTVKGQKVIDTVTTEGWNSREVLIDGFKQDSLTITQNYGSHVVLANNNIRSVNAAVGETLLSGSILTILKNNQFENAKLRILNRSKLILHQARIQHLDYSMADSTQLLINGAANNTLKR
jgi:hypothetical protein